MRSFLRRTGAPAVGWWRDPRSAPAKAFVGVWVGYFALALLLPVRSLWGYESEAFLLQGAFVAVVASCLALAARGQADPAVAPTEDPALLDALDRRIVLGSLALAALGTLCLAVDRLLVQDLDFSGGISSMKSEMIRSRQARSGASSPWSVVGYALCTSFVCAFQPLLARFERFSTAFLARTGAALLSLLLVDSVLLAGRSTVFLTTAFLAGFAVLRRLRGGSPLRLPGRLQAVSFLAAALSVAYLLLVFADRAEVSSADRSEYMDVMVEYMGGRPDPWLADFVRRGGTPGEIASYAVLSLYYLSHSFHVAGALVAAPDGDTYIAFGYLRDLLHRLGIGPEPNLGWVLSGLFPSVPGTLYHDGGWAALFLGALGLGAVGFLLARRLAARPPAFLVDCLGAAFFVVLFASPFLLVTEMLSFPFLILEFLLVSVLLARKGRPPRALRLPRKPPVGVPLETPRRGGR